MRLIKNNRDKVFWSFWTLWIIASIIFIAILNVEPIIVHGIAMVIFTIIVVFDNTNKKFNNWLNIKL